MDRDTGDPVIVVAATQPAVTRLGSATSAAAAELRWRNARRDVSSTPQLYRRGRY
jgi:hypothetical protein